MLTKFKMFAVIAVAAMAFMGCAKEESSLSIDDLPGRAKVKGTVYYSNEQKYIKETEDTDPMLKDLYVPKAEVKVLAKIDNASLDAGANGYTIFETTTDAEGRYEFEIPVPENGVEIELEALPFEGTKNSFDSLYRKEPKFSEKAGVFENGGETVRLLSNDIKNQDIKYGFTPKPKTELEDVAADNFTKTILRVNVYEGVYSNSYYSYPSFLTSNSQITVSVTDGNNIDKSLKTENGIAVFEILHTTKSDVELTVTVTSNSYRSSLEVPDFGEEVQGKYQQFYCTDSKWSEKDITKVWEDGFKGQQTMTVSYDDYSRTLNVCLIFKPDRTNTDFNDGYYNTRYYQEWVEAYFMY